MDTGGEGREGRSMGAGLDVFGFLRRATGLPGRKKPRLPGEGEGDLVSASGRGATGCTGRVCLAASFFRLACLRWNISSVLSCF